MGHVEALPDVDVAVTYRRVEREDERNGPDASARAARIDHRLHRPDLPRRVRDVDPVMKRDDTRPRRGSRPTYEHLRWAPRRSQLPRRHRSLAGDSCRLVPPPAVGEDTCLAYNNPARAVAGRGCCAGDPRRPSRRRACACRLRATRRVERRFTTARGDPRIRIRIDAARDAECRECAERDGRVAFGVVGDTGQTEVTAQSSNISRPCPTSISCCTRATSRTRTDSHRVGIVSGVSRNLSCRACALVVPGSRRDAQRRRVHRVSDAVPDPARLQRLALAGLVVVRRRPCASSG